MQFLVNEQSGGSSVFFIVTMVGIFAAFYFFLIRPQKKQAKKFQEDVKKLKVGDKVVTRGGVRGEIIGLKANSFIIKSGNSELEFLKQALSYIENDENSINTKNQVLNDFSYGNDKRFKNKLEELKIEKQIDKELDLLLEDVYEYVVLENNTSTSDIAKTFRISELRADNILNQLTELGILGSLQENGNRSILIDPR